MTAGGGMTALKTSSAQNGPKPQRLSWLYLYRMYRFANLVEKFEKNSEKYTSACKNNEYELARTPSYYKPYMIGKLHAKLKRYQGRMLVANGKICFLVPKIVRITSENVRRSFVEKQVEKKELGRGKRVLRELKGIAIQAAVTSSTGILFGTAVYASALALVPEILQAMPLVKIFDPAFSSPTVVITLISFLVGWQLSYKVDNARKMLGVGRKEAEALLAKVEKHDA
jgi:hypothetical protein